LVTVSASASAFAVHCFAWIEQPLYVPVGAVITPIRANVGGSATNFNARIARAILTGDAGSHLDCHLAVLAELWLLSG
jgi:hypothetical protein